MENLSRTASRALGLGVLFLVGSAATAAAATAVGPTSTSTTAVSAPVTTVNKATYTLSLGTELMEGDTTYQIGYPITMPNGAVIDGYFPISELEWPLDIWLARLQGSARINDQWRLNATIKKDLSTPDDNMVDSDWTTASNPSRLDVYSESEISSFDALIMDLDVEWTFIRRKAVSFYAGLGYLYQDFDYDSKVISQHSPSGLPGFDFTGDGRVSVTYETTYSMPYLKVGTEIQVTPDLNLTGSFSYSPFVDAEDTDNHLLREFGGKINTGDMDGDAYMFDVSGKYLFTSALFLEAGFHYLRIEVDGTQNQVYGWGFPLGTVAEEAESTQTSGYLSIGYKF